MVAHIFKIIKQTLLQQILPPLNASTNIQLHREKTSGNHDTNVMIYAKQKHMRQYLAIEQRSHFICLSLLYFLFCPLIVDSTRWLFQTLLSCQLRHHFGCHRRHVTADNLDSIFRHLHVQIEAAYLEAYPSS